MIESVRALWMRYFRRSRAVDGAPSTVRRLPARRRVFLPVCDELAIGLWTLPGLRNEADAIDPPKASVHGGVFARIESDR